MPRTGNAASVGRQSSLRRRANERQGSRRRFYGVRWLQMAAELLRHGVFLDKDQAPRRASAWAFLLDGTEHGSFFGVELCRPQTVPQRQTLGRRRMGNVLQLQSLRDGGVGGFRVARRPATCRRAQPESHRIHVSSSPRGSLYSRKSAGVWKTRAVWMLHSAPTGKDCRALPEAAARKHCREPSGGQDSGLTSFIQLRAGYGPSRQRGVRLAGLKHGENKFPERAIGQLLANAPTPRPSQL